MTTPNTDPLYAAMQKRGVLPPDEPGWKDRVMGWIREENKAKAARMPEVSPDTTAADTIAALGPQQQPAVPALNDARILQAAADAQVLGRQRSLADEIRAALGDPGKVQHPPTP